MLDYEKVIADTNKDRSDETIDSYFEFILNQDKEEPQKGIPKPLLTFKKMNKCPEYLDREFSRASVA